MGNQGHVTAENAIILLRSCSGWRVSAFHAKGGNRVTPLQGQLDLLLDSFTFMLKYNFDPPVAADAACFSRLQPMFSALQQATAKNRAHVLQHVVLYSENSMQTALVR